MITKSKLIYDLKEVISGYYISDDFKLDDRQVGFWIDNQRIMLLRQDQAKGRTLDIVLVQDLGCVPIEVVDRAECCNIDTDCDIIRTIDEIPIPVEGHNRPLIERVGFIDKVSRPFTFISYHHSPFAGNGRFNSKSEYAFYRDRRIYVLLRKNNPFLSALEYINIQLVAENPEDAARYKTCSGQPCYSDDSSYPISGWMIEIMKQNILKVNMPEFYNNITERANDGSSISDKDKQLGTR